MCSSASSSFSSPIYDDYAHRVFLNTNELDQEKTLLKLATIPVSGDTFVGVSGFFSLNAVAARANSRDWSEKIKHIYILDRSVRVEAFWSRIPEIIKGSSCRSEVVEKVKLLINEKKEVYFSGGKRSTPTKAAAEAVHFFEMGIIDGTSWLSSDEKFNAIKKIFDKGRFAFRLVDLFWKDQVEAFMDELYDQERTIDTVYLSNVHEYLESEEDGMDYMDSLVELIEPNTVVVHTQPRGVFTKLRQKVTIGVPKAINLDILERLPLASERA